MNKPDFSRRDWLKTAALTGGFAAFAAPRSSAQPPKEAGKKIRGVIFMVSDGMSPGVLTLGEAWSQLTRKSGTRWWALMNDRKAARGLMDTASANSLVTDSAAASTSWGGGERVNNGAINVRPDGRPLVPLAHALGKKGVRIGLVSTATITHATPAGFAAVCTERGNEEEIATQYLKTVDVLLGGGSGYFSKDERPDKRDLSGEFSAAGYDVVGNRDAMLAAKSPKLLGTFSRGHIPYSIDRDASDELKRTVPTLTEMATAALGRFLEGDKPFLLQIEGARIDHAAHRNDIGALLHDQIAFDDALAHVLATTAGRDDILVIATSDHGNANPGLNGTGGGYGKTNGLFGSITKQKASYEALFTDWTKLSRPDDKESLKGLVSSRLGFGAEDNEISALLDIFAKKPVIEWNEQLAKPEGLLGQIQGNHTGIGWTGTSHTTDPTLVSAFGPQCDRFTGMVRNSDVYGHLIEMLG
ncbi:alkaline phosphatase [Luteolibacter sp. SL250]|uniref:alkaline phosphatase n=1 Tax=Luteolibacter sp. SL250 TaxID=2995170 RepID=UPI00226FDE6F|nr:alkaline phosphatase [Luteolibacter sp. SL250]WAC21369.1 alkaline phosphatase [Luteolibacter sp. SL250]